MASLAGDAYLSWSAKVAGGGSMTAYFHHVPLKEKATNDDYMKMSVAEYKSVEAMENLYA